MENVNIDLFRVSPDSKYLDIIVSCDEHYYFSSFILEAHKLNNNGKYDVLKYNLTNYLLSVNNEVIKDLNSWTFRIPLNNLSITTPCIYIGQFGINARALEESSTDLESTIAITSDVNFVYDNLATGILSLSEKCFEIDDNLIRNYLILWAHVEALRLRNIEDAKYYYKLLLNNFSICGNKSNCGNAPINEPKNCGCK